MMFFKTKAEAERHEMPTRTWNPEWSRNAWWAEFSLLVGYTLDENVTSLMALHRNRAQAIAAARDIADDMIAAFEDRWAE